MIVANPGLYFDIYVDRGHYISYGILVALTKVPNAEFTVIQPMYAIDAELCKYKYSYACPVQNVNALPNTGDIIGATTSTSVKMFYLHD